MRGFEKPVQPFERIGLAVFNRLKFSPHLGENCVKHELNELVLAGEVIEQPALGHVGVGRDGFRFSGVHRITMKKEWPDWTPPAQMLKRRPDLPRHMKGGPENPLGARALYLGSTLYRIHGTDEPDTIGQAVSSGCFRMTNSHVTDLANRVGVGTVVIVKRKL